MTFQGPTSPNSILSWKLNSGKPFLLEITTSMNCGLFCLCLCYSMYASYFLLYGSVVYSFICPVPCRSWDQPPLSLHQHQPNRSCQVFYIPLSPAILVGLQVDVCSKLQLPECSTPYLTRIVPGCTPDSNWANHSPFSFRPWCWLVQDWHIT